jgi:hypothetical protein
MWRGSPEHKAVLTIPSDVTSQWLLVMIPKPFFTWVKVLRVIMHLNENSSVVFLKINYLSPVYPSVLCILNCRQWFMGDINVSIRKKAALVLRRYPKGKGKVVPVLNWAPRHEDVLGSGGIAPRILWPPALDGGERSASRTSHFTPTERAPGTR